MAKVIDSLTPEQEALLDVYAEKWEKIGLSCEPINKERATAAIRKAYECAKLTPPQRIEFFPSPEAAVKAAMKASGDTREEVLSGVAWGSMDAGWISFYDYAREVLGLKEETEELVGLTMCAKEVGWFIPYDEACFVSERSVEIHRDDQFQAHNPNGPAILYRDGFSVWCIDGVDVTEQIVMRPQTLTVAQIEAMDNLEVRAIAIRRFGPGKFFTEAGCVVLDMDSVPVDALAPTGPAITRALFRDAKNQCWLFASDGGTGRCFAMSTDEGTKTCQEAYQRMMPPDFQPNALIEC